MDEELKADEIKIGEDIKVVEEDVAAYVKDLEAKVAEKASDFENKVFEAAQKMKDEGSILAEEVRRIVLEIRNDIKHSFAHQTFLDDILRRLGIL
jgi:hypothetical protein